MGVKDMLVTQMSHGHVVGHDELFKVVDVVANSGASGEDPCLRSQCLVPNRRYSKAKTNHMLARHETIGDGIGWH